MSFLKTILFNVFLFICLATNYSFFLSKTAKASDDDRHIPVFLASDNNYAPFVATTMVSILKNTNSYIDFIILSDGINDVYKQKINNTSKYFNKKNFSVKFVEMNKDIYKGLSANERITRAMYNRFEMCDVDNKIMKAIYLDVDIIVKSDIKKLYDQDLDGYIIGAVPENQSINNFYSPRLSQITGATFLKHRYFNSGVLLVDCKKYRENGVKNKLYNLARKYSSNKLFSCQDQDALNIYFNNDYKILDRIYNNTACFFKGYIKEMKFNKIEEKNFIDNTVVIHYVGVKPWTGKDGLFVEKFWDSVQYTDFVEIINSKSIVSTGKQIKIVKNRFRNHLIIIYALIAINMIFIASVTGVVIYKKSRKKNSK